MIASIQTPCPGWDAKATGRSSPRRDSRLAPDARTGTPPHELITKRRCTPSTSAHAAGLLESISAGRSSRGADTSRAVGVLAVCAASTATASHEAARLLETRDQ